MYIPLFFTLLVLHPHLSLSLSLPNQFSPPPKPTPFNFSEITSIIAFGDSYTFVQGTRGRANFSFIGDEQHLGFSPDELFSNAIVQNQTGTAGGGPNWIEYLTGCGVERGLTMPRECGVQLWDFAFAGAGVGGEFIPLHHPYTTSLTQQIAQFTQYAHKPLSTLPTTSPQKTLISSWIGINDISDSATWTNISHPSFYKTLQTAHFAQIQTLYNLGYRYFLFPNLPPLHRTPARQKSYNPDVNATMVAWFNDALVREAVAFQQRAPKARVFVFDTTAVWNRVLDEPGRYGFENVREWCPGVKEGDVFENPGKYGCGELGGYFWWDGGHVGWRGHEVLAQEVRGYLLGGKG